MHIIIAIFMRKLFIHIMILLITSIIYEHIANKPVSSKKSWASTNHCVDRVNTSLIPLDVRLHERQHEVNAKSASLWQYFVYSRKSYNLG